MARFLHERAGLSKQRIGEFLGEIRIDFNMAVLEYVNMAVLECVNARLGRDTCGVYAVIEHLGVNQVTCVYAG